MRQDARTAVDETARRGNYESGADYVLEYGELRFSFNERDFAQRVEQAAVKLDFVRQGLDEHELEDLLELAVNGEIREPCSPRSVEQEPRPLAAAPRLPGRLARPAGQGGRARHRFRRGHADVRLRPAGPRLGADRALRRALLGRGCLRRPGPGVARLAPELPRLAARQREVLVPCARYGEPKGPKLDRD
jgi:hypothetical protein